MKQRLAIARNHDPKDNGQKRQVNLPGFLLASDYEGENGGEKRRRRPNGLVEGYGKVAERGVAADDGEAEDGAEGKDLEELLLGMDVLEGNDFEEVDGGVRVGGAG